MIWELDNKKEGVAVAKRTVLPISGRKLGEFCRLLEERGVGDEIFQQLIEDPNRLVEFILGEYVRQLSPKDRQELRRAGWEIVQVPGILIAPVTLNQLFLRAKNFGAKSATSWHGDFTREDIEYLPLPAGEIAWMPKDPLIPGSTDKSFAEQEEVVADFSRQVQKRFGDGVEAIFPTAEQGVYLLFDHCRRMGKYVLQTRHTRTLNRFGSDRLSVGLFDKGGWGVNNWDPEFRYWALGVLRLVVPVLGT